MLGIVIVPDEEKTNLNNSQIKYNITKEDTEGHLSLLKKFINDNNIDIDVNNKTSYELSIELIEIGYMNIHFENRMIIIYLPDTLSNNQASYIKQNINGMKRYDLKLVSYDGCDIEFIENDEDDYETNMVNVVMKNVKKKLKKRKKEEGMYEERSNRLS